MKGSEGNLHMVSSASSGKTVRVLCTSCLQGGWWEAVFAGANVDVTVWSVLSHEQFPFGALACKAERAKTIK